MKLWFLLLLIVACFVVDFLADDLKLRRWHGPKEQDPRNLTPPPHPR